MKVKLSISAAILMVCFFLSSASAAKRCGSDIMDVGRLMHIAEEKCGKPDSKERVGEVRYIETSGKVERVIYLTELIYKESGGYYVLTFEGSRLVKSEFIR